MKKIFTLAFFLHLVPLLHAQYVDYENDSKWFWDLNLGGTWSTTDVNDQVDVGYGLLIGRSFNSNYGRQLRFDLRMRYLHGLWYGQDYDTTNIGNYDPVYLPTELETYKNNPGFTVNNFQTDVHELGLELALHANRVRERTGWDPYIFGGINIAWNQTYSNLLQNDSSFTGGNGTYDYSDPALINEGYINSIHDYTYDTPMNLGSEGGNWNADIVPSLGFGIGYYFSPFFSIGFEHKTSWARKNDWDGFEQSSDMNEGPLNDVYHYSSGYLRFHIRSRKNDFVEPQPEPEPTSNFTPCDDPVVRFVQPGANQSEVEQQVVEFIANVSNVDQRENIVVRINNKETTNFFFDENTNDLRGNCVLSEGVNTIQIIASNGCGNDVETITVNYVTCNDPIVNFINPSHDNFHVDQPTYTINATISNLNDPNGIGSESNIVYSLNGIRSNSFTYNSTSGSFTANATLRNGRNTITVTAENNCGSVTKTINVIFTDCEDPFIEFSIGNGSTLSTDQEVTTISAYVRDVSTESAIGLRVNGVNTPFGFEGATGLLQSSLALSPGQNTIQITAGNRCGTDTEMITIVYTPCTDPVVSIIAPATNNTTTNRGSILVRATVTSISAADEIQMYVNGVAIGGGTYANSAHVFSQTAPLNAGLNTIQLVATNECGTDTKTITINYDAPCPEPMVSMVSNSSLTNDSIFQLQAAIQNITSANQISTVLNNVTQNGGAYTASNHVFQNTVVLNEGVNTIVVTATNDCGTDNKTFVITYRKPCDLPVIGLINPMSSPLQSATPSLNLQASIQNVSQANQVGVAINGVVHNSGYFSTRANTYQTNVQLQMGENVIVITATNGCGTTTETLVVNYTPCLEPSVLFTLPKFTFTQNNSTLIRATIQNVASLSQIQLLVNGVAFSGSYSALTGIFQSNVALQSGVNIIQLIATNDCGNDAKMKTLTYTPCLNPQINIIAPNTISTQNNTTTVQASITNITAANQVQLLVNGIAVQGTYNAVKNIYTSNVPLQTGSNLISIVATNNCGSDSERIGIRYTEPCDPPTISVFSPLDRTSTRNSTIRLSATVANVTAATQIITTVNGTVVSGGLYNPAKKIYSATIPLRRGSNRITITAMNACGSVTTSITVIRNNPVPVPTDKNPENDTRGNTKQGPENGNKEPINKGSKEIKTPRQGGGI
jgi:hypothetical protein